MKKTTLISTILFFALHVGGMPPSHGAEIDSVTPRNVALQDAAAEVNRVINQRIAEGIERANLRQKDVEDIDSDEFCDEEILYDELRKAIYQSFTASLGLKGYSLDKQFRELLAAKSYSLPLRDSIYRDIDFIEGFSLNLKELSHVANLDGHLIGLDKIGHFFAEGWDYFEMTHFEGKPLKEALQWGKEQEEGKFGLATTGIFSYADLVANFNGWRFWGRVLKNSPDPLKNFFNRFFTGSYVQCSTRITDSLKYRKRVRQWRQNARFDITDYIDGAWDEGNNCSSYRDPIIEHKVSRRITETAPAFRCPAEPDQCSAARRKYGSFGRDLLHPRCLSFSP